MADGGSTQQLIGPGANGPLQSGSSSYPIYQTDYRDAEGKVIASVTGPDRRVGGGTISAPDQGHGGTIEGNVAAINRQIEAVRSLNEARQAAANPGSVAAPAYASSLPTPPAMGPFGRPGDGYGDSQLRRNRYEGMLQEAATGRGLTRNRRNAMIDSAQALLAPGLAAMQQEGQAYRTLADLTGTLAQQQGRGVSPLEMARFGLEQRNADLAQQRFGLEQQNALADQYRLGRAAAWGERKDQWDRDYKNSRPMTRDQVLGQLGTDMYRLQQVANDTRLSEDQRANASARLNQLQKFYGTFSTPGQMFGVE